MDDSLVICPVSNMRWDECVARRIKKETLWGKRRKTYLVVYSTAEGEMSVGCGVKQVCGKELTGCKLNAGGRGFGGDSFSRGYAKLAASGEGKAHALLI